MRLSNRKKAPLYNFISNFLLMIIVIAILGVFLGRLKFNILHNELILIVIIIIFALFLFYLREKQIFEYDSDGEALNFKNRNIFSFLNKEQNDEFPKYKLINYEIVKFLFFRRLYIIIISKNKGSTVLKYEVSYLSKKQMNDLKLSLNKVIKANKEKDINNK